MIPLYLKSEPTTDYTTRAWCTASGAPFPGKWRDVVAYRDQACSVIAGRWPWHYISKPRRKCKRVMFNCYRWQAVWVAA